MIHTVLEYPNPALQVVSTPVEQVTPLAYEFCRDLVETLQACRGLGLSAPQLGVPRRIIAIDMSNYTGKDEPGYVLINPEITSSEGEQVCSEGCLSLPGIIEEVTRAEQVTVRARKVNGEVIELVADDMMAIALQHEIDHLDGILFFDKVSRMRRDIAKRKLHKRACRGGQAMAHTLSLVEFDGGDEPKGAA